MTYSEKLKDPRWQKKRLEIFNRDSFTCQLCSDDKKPLSVHHKQYSGEPWEAPNEALLTICELCHSAIHFLNEAFSGAKDKFYNRFELVRVIKNEYIDQCALACIAQLIEDRTKYSILFLEKPPNCDMSFLVSGVTPAFLREAVSYLDLIKSRNQTHYNG